MKDFRKKVSGDIVIAEDSQYHKVHNANIIVEPNVTVRIFGSIKDLHIKKNATVYLHGSLSGNLVNNGGLLNTCTL